MFTVRTVSILFVTKKSCPANMNMNVVLKIQKIRCRFLTDHFTRQSDQDVTELMIDIVSSVNNVVFVVWNAQQTAFITFDERMI